MSFIKGFKYAFCGMIYCIKNERNMRFHTAAALYVLVFARFFDFSRSELILLLLTIGAVISAEVINTAIEELCDKTCSKYDIHIKNSKDAAAGAVLVLAIFAAAIGIILFCNTEGWSRAYDFYISHPINLCGLAVSGILSVMYVTALPKQRNNEKGKVKKMTKTAFIAIVGRPNVGKSSILNKMLGEKIAIVSSKPQTTRTRIMGVLTEKDSQLVFIDTPGLHKPRNSLDKYMLRSINESVAGVDMCVLVVEADRKISEEEQQLIEKFKSADIPALLAINKIDTINDKTVLAAQINEISSLYDFCAVVPCSAQTGSGIDILKDEMRKLAPEGDFMFDEDTLTDQPERVIAAEIIREKLLRLLEREVPHGSAVFVERMKERESADIIDIDAVIYCERDSHKGIIIGKGGSMLKRIGTYARQDMEKFFDCKINLQIWVKVKEDWRNRESILRSLGYDENEFN